MKYFAIASLLCGAFGLAAEPNIASEEFRRQFIASFQRTSLNTTPEDAMMLRILVESRGAKRGVEVGSASGFGAINMGIAFERTGGRLDTLEIDPERVRQTRENLKAVGLDKVVTVIEGDALRTLANLEGGIDFLFLDALKKDYLKYLKLVEAKLTKGAVIVADNVIVSQKAMADYLEYVQKNPAYETVTIRCSDEKGDGMTVTYKVR